MKDEIFEAMKDLYSAVIDYVEYKHDGDPWTEDRRAMGEMDIDEMNRDGRLAKYYELIKLHDNDEKEGNQHLEDGVKDEDD